MIHLCGTGGTLMLNMTAAAILDARVKRRRLLREAVSRGRMTRDTGSCLYSSCGSVAGFAFVAQKGVLGRQRTRLK